MGANSISGNPMLSKSVNLLEGKKKQETKVKGVASYEDQ